MKKTLLYGLFKFCHPWDYSFTSFYYLCRNSDPAMARKDILNKKVLLKLSSFVKFSQNFKSREDNRQWHHIIGLYSPQWLLTYPLVWAIVFTSDYGNARSLTGVVRTVSSHTFFLYPLLSGNWLAQ